MLEISTTRRRTPHLGRMRKGRPGMLRSHEDYWDPMNLKGKRVVVVGAGASGVAAADFCLRRGARVVVSDRQDPEALGVTGKDLSRWGARLAPGGHPLAVFKKADLIVLSPGIPGNLPALTMAREAGIPIVGEVELACRHLKTPLIAITGTNGKSTTTAFIGQLLRGSGHRAFVGGNFGTPLSRSVDGDHDVIVAELSSFQLETLESMKPRVSILLNISEDHLERYDSFEHYAQTKGNIFQGQRLQDIAIVNADDLIAEALAKNATGQVHRFGVNGPQSLGAWLEGQDIRVRTHKVDTLFSLEGFTPPGRHNRENLMAAILAVLAHGLDVEDIQQNIPRLEGLSHRMEQVAKIKGVTYFNDSKATNIASVVASCSGLKAPMVLLLGGKDKGGDLAPLRRLVEEKVHHVVLFGAARHRMAEALIGACELDSVETLAQAVNRGSQAANAGDLVVLSPACSSYDQFSNYRERGRTFRALVAELSSLGGK